MVVKNKVRECLSDSIDTLVNYEDGITKLKALGAIKDIIDEFSYELSLLIGEQGALIEINKTKDK